MVAGVCEMKGRVKVKLEEKPVPPVDRCSHYWVIEVANGPKSLGKCKHCGEVREFFNAIPDFNPMRRKNNPLDLPKLPEVEIDKDSES
jgi:hypothetical protein